jgi:hypothetical protein
MAMDIDEDEGVQVETYGIQVDFENLDAEDREASSSSTLLSVPLLT